MLGFLSGILQFFYTNGQTVYFYYTIALLLLLAGTFAANFGKLRASFSKIKKNYMLAILAVAVVFVIVELLFVHPTQQLYNDEYIHMSIAKVMLESHYAGICSFSNSTTCVPGTAGLFQQPIGWDLLMAIDFGIFGVGFPQVFNLVLMLSFFSIILVFYIAYMLFGEKTALFAAVSFAATPLFITYSRSNVLDIPELFVALLAIALFLMYMQNKRAITGMAALFAVAYATIMKVDAAIILPILLVMLLVDRHPFTKKKELLKFAGMAALLFAILIPQFIFVYNTNHYNTFGQQLNQSKLSIEYLVNNTETNAPFWLGAYNNVVDYGQNWHIEYPLTFSLLALAGLAVMAYRKRYREAIGLFLWFAIVFAFYSSYYAGSVLYGLGDDVRYYMIAFPVISIFLGFFLANAHDWLSERTRKIGGKKREDMYRKALFVALLALLLAEPIMLFVNVVTIQPLKMPAFAFERAEEQLILQNYNLVPKGCMVLTFKPPLWYVLNVSNIYATWIFTPSNYAEAVNMSHGCFYFDQSVSCAINNECVPIYDNFTLAPVAVERFTNFTWNNTMGIYRITGFNSSGAFKDIAKGGIVG